MDRMYTGGAQTMLLALARGIDRERWQPHLVCFAINDSYRAEFARLGIPVTLIERTGKLDFRAVLRLRALLREHAPCVLHTWVQAPNFYGWMATRGLRGCGLLLSMLATRYRPTDEIDGSKLWRRLSFTFHSAIRWLATHQGALIEVNADAIRQELLEEGVPDQAIHVVPNGLTIPEGPRPQPGAPIDSPNIVAVFRLVPRKGCHVLLDALAMLPEQVRLTIVGDGPERANLEAQAARLGLSQRVCFAGDQADIYPWLAAAHIFCLPSLRGEGLSNSLLEAMAVGLPCVGAATGGTPEVLLDEQCGLLVPPDDPPALAAALRRLTESATLRQQLGDAGRQRFQECFTEQRYVQRLTELYEAVADRRAR